MMRCIFILIIALFCLEKSVAQEVVSDSEILTAAQVSTLFTNDVRKKFNINFSIYRAYRYTDKRGQYYCLLTENQDEINKDKNSVQIRFNQKIKAINLKLENGSFTKTWEINDHIKIGQQDEKSIWFWGRYVQFSDYDHDGLIEPLLVYGTLGMNNFSDGSIKFIIYYKGQKIAIRHQNSTLDDERETQIDKSFYALPVKLIETIKDKMNLMITNKHAIFPYGWQKAMKDRKIFFSERGD